MSEKYDIDRLEEDAKTALGRWKLSMHPPVLLAMCADLRKYEKCRGLLLLLYSRVAEKGVAYFLSDEERERMAEALAGDSDEQGCAIVGCEIPMPHTHEIQGPGKA